jgi:hypothetical protein
MIFFEDTYNDGFQSTGVAFKKQINAAGNTALTAGGAIALQLGASTSPAVFFGSGVPTITAPQGSLYLRSDGSSTSTRMYINTTGSTTWTNVTTAA